RRPAGEARAVQVARIGYANGGARQQRAEDVPLERVVGETRKHGEPVSAVDAEAPLQERLKVREGAVPSPHPLRPPRRSGGEGDTSNVVRPDVGAQRSPRNAREGVARAEPVEARQGNPSRAEGLLEE